MSVWFGEVRYAARVLWKNRTATLVAFVTLALAIGATTALFTVVDATLVRALPFPEADRLMQIARGYPNTVSTASPPKFLHWREQTRDLFAHVAAYDSLGGGFNLVGAGQPDRLIGSRVSAEFFSVMGVRPIMGREFRAEEDLPGHAKVVVLSHQVWTRRFGARADLVGQAITLNGEPYTVIGVMPEGFRYPDKTVLWTLFQLDPASQERGNYFEVAGRLKPGVTLDRARAAMPGVAASFRRQHADMMGEREVIVVRPLRERLYGDMRASLLVLLSAVGCVLLIACVNVANLQLAQTSERHHEIALRTALGASRGIIVRQLLIESLLLAAISGVAGLVLAFWGVPALLALSPIDVPQAAAIRVDLRVLGFALGVSLLSGIAFGLLPAWQAGRTQIDRVLRAGASRTTGGVAGTWMRRTLIAGEVALALMLTIGAFLLVKSLAGLRARDPGFTVEQVITAKLSLPEAKYGRGETLALFQEQVDERLRALPGVHAAAVAHALPMQVGFDLPFTIEGKYVKGTDGGVGDAYYRPIGPGFFQALRIPLRRGRLFTAQDRRGTLQVAIVNEEAARLFWKGQNPIGQRITVGQPFIPDLADPSPREIVGIVGDVREEGQGNRPPAVLYLPMSQQNDNVTAAIVRLLPVSVVVRAEGAAGAVTQAVQQAIWSVDPAQPVSDVRLMREIVERSLGGQTFNTVLLGGLAGLALLLAAVGLYGVISHLVGQQTREIGIRMALGATHTSVLALFVRHALLLVAGGILIGLAGAFGMTRFLRTLLSDISTTDPWVFVLAPTLLLAIALIAALRPALRAARIDPVRALRAD
jgi:putative ABC transport system permease protein